jgi:restriction system protein
MAASGAMTADTPLVLRESARNAQLLLQTVIVPGARTDEGKLIEAVTIPWFDIIDLLKKDPNVAFQISPEKWEEIIAGAYCRAGFDEVTLTPRSGDYGRDVIAIKKALGTVRVIDQVKAFKPPHLVTANDVRALIGVLRTDGASKGFLTTTSDFAPKIKTDPTITHFIPFQLELINGTKLLAKLEELARNRPDGN